MTDATPILQLKIDNKQDLDLQDFNDAVQSLGNQYYSHLKACNAKRIKSTHKLYIKEIKQGSIIIELCEKAPELLPAIAPSIVEFGCYITHTMDYLVGRKDSLKREITKRDFLDFKNIFKLSANLKGNITGFIGLNFGGDVVVNNHYNDTEAAAGQNKCNKEIEIINEREPESFIKERVNLDLYQARNSNLSKAGNMGIISEVSDKPKVLSYATDRLRYDLTNAEDNPFNYTYLVDVEVKMREGKSNYDDHRNIFGYEILKLHSTIETKDMFDN